VEISGDGRYVAFITDADDIAPSDDPFWDTFVIERAVAPPVVSSVTPASIARGATATVTVRGSRFEPDATVVVPDGVSVGTVTYVSGTRLRAELTVDANAALGARAVAVTNPGPGPGVVPGSVGACNGCLTITN
jgi:hypothetical protein